MIAAACDTLKRNREKYPGTAHERRNREAFCVKLRRIGCGRKTNSESSRWNWGLVETGFSKAILEKGLDGFFRRIHAGKFSLRCWSRTWQRTAEQCIQSAIGNRQSAIAMARSGIARPHRGGEHSQSDADEPHARPAHALGAVREMRERRVVFAPAVRAFDLPCRSEARRVPGNRRMARRQLRIGKRAVCPRRLPDGDGQRRNARGNPPRGCRRKSVFSATASA